MRYFLLTSILSFYSCGGMDSDTPKPEKMLSDPNLTEESKLDFPNNELEIANNITFRKDIKPIIKKHCIFCHNGLIPARKNLGQYNVAKEYGEIMLAYMEGNGNIVMPPSGPLSDTKVDLVRQWIETGKQK